MWALAVAPLCAAPASASSITCYGCIVISTLGTEGMTATDPDMAIAEPVPAAVEVGGLLATSNPPATIKDTPSTGNVGGADTGSGNSGSPVNTPRSTPGGGAPPSDSAIIDSGSIPVPSPDGVPIDGPKPQPSEEIPLPPIDSGPIETVQVPVPAAPPNDVVQTAVPDSAGSVDDVARTPEPATVTLLGIAGIGAWLRARRRR
jgi:hypothetical protein